MTKYHMEVTIWERVCSVGEVEVDFDGVSYWMRA